MKSTKEVTMEDTDLVKENELLKQEVEKLKKQINQKNKKIAKLRKERNDLCSEIDELDTYEPLTEEVNSLKDERCPKCGCELDYIFTELVTGNLTIITCKRCEFRKTNRS
jgi:uncharacterized coiled-coil DUF342 family protein